MNSIIWSPFKNPYTSLYDLKLSKSKYKTQKGVFLDNRFFSSACICTLPGKPVSGLILLFIDNSLFKFFFQEYQLLFTNVYIKTSSVPFLILVFFNNNASLYIVPLLRLYKCSKFVI